MPPLDAVFVTRVAKSSLTGLSLPKGISRESLQPPVETLSKAVSAAWATWQTVLTLRDVRIQGPIAMGGKLTAPPIDPFVRANIPPALKQYAEPLAAGLQQQLALFCSTVTVAGMPWYPSFAAFPGPVAPPTPNVPCPLLTIATGARSSLSRTALMQAIFTRLPFPRPTGAEQVCSALCGGIETAVQTWLMSTMVTMVMGTGPVPTFAPPYTPVGPVVGGVGNQVPGGMV